VIRSGETLSQLAFKYQVSMDQLMKANSLKGDQLRVGQSLIIPTQNSDS
jgi:N-acetylmuramoyl-L-alanine amidase